MYLIFLESIGLNWLFTGRKEMRETELPMSVFFIPVTGSNFVDRLLYSLDFCQNDTLCCHLSQAQKDLQVSVCTNNASS